MRKLLILLLMFCSNFIYGQNSQFTNFRTKTKTKFLSETLIGYKQSSDCGKVEIYYIEFEDNTKNQLVIKYEKIQKPKLWYSDNITYRFAIQELKNYKFTIVKEM